MSVTTQAHGIARVEMEQVEAQPKGERAGYRCFYVRAIDAEGNVVHTTTLFLNAEHTIVHVGGHS